MIGIPLQISTFLAANHSKGSESAMSRADTNAPTVKSLAKATKTLGFKSKQDDGVTNLATDSRRVIPGSLFFALPGLRTDGNTFVEEAIGRGAVGVVTETKPKRPLPVPMLHVPNARRALAEISAAFYDHPEKALRMQGVTGTNGKTTVTILAQHLMAKEAPVGLIGTVRYDVGRRTFPAFRTTPEALDCFALMDQMRNVGCESAVMEVSSHGIEQERVWGIPYETAVFTNLTQDHLDYHETFEAYYNAKKQLFTGVGAPPPKVSIINIDDEWGSRLADEISSTTDVWSFGKASNARFKICIKNLDESGARFEILDMQSGDIQEVESSLLGEYNVYNLVAAILMAKSAGKSDSEIADRLASLPAVPGRMELVAREEGVNILVDYAHTDDALSNALGMLKTITPKTVHVVFGCGGDRDRSKRRKMVDAALGNADKVILTADNPRSESLDHIFADMCEGLSSEARENLSVVRDRREAILSAINSAQSGDCVLIAGKGHENFQEINGALIPFEDKQVVKELLSIREMSGR